MKQGCKPTPTKPLGGGRLPFTRNRQRSMQAVGRRTARRHRKPNVDFDL